MGDATPLVLCADDYALGDGVSQAIVDLLRAGRISAVSCMTASPHWSSHATALKPFVERADLGLHFTLTDLAPLGPVPGVGRPGAPARLGGVLRLGLLRRLPAGAIAAELARQLDAFRAGLGRDPDFIDGHQHVHLLPHVWPALVAAARDRRIYLRCCHEPLVQILGRGVSSTKATFLAALSLPLRKAARRSGIATNDSFRGVSDFHPGPACTHEFRRFLTGPGRRPLVMCHPGRADAALQDDPIAARRQDEARHLASDEFLAAVATAGVRIARFSACETAHT